MTPEHFEETLRQGPEACLQALASASELQRRAAAPVALRWHKLLRQVPHGHTIEGVSYQAVWRIVPLILLATGTLSEIKKARCRVSSDDETLRWLEQRRPDWLQDWAAWVLEVQPGSWALIRQLIQRGLIAKPAAPSYTMALITGSQRRSVFDMLTADPELLEDVWKLFEIEGSGENSLASFDKYMAESNNWNYALLTLCQQGKLPRPRLLDASLQALARDFEAFRAGWFARFHENLQPTVAERQQRLPLYLGQLGSRISATVSFAVKALSKIQILAPDLLAHLAPALNAREKGTVLSALKLLRQVVKQPSPALAGLLEPALGHESPDVQKALLQALQSYFPTPPKSLQENPPEVAASLRPNLEKWLAISPLRPAQVSFESLEAPPEPGRTLVQWDHALESWGQGQEPDPLAPGPGRQQLKPVQHLSELVQLYAEVLETGGPPIEVERVLDGVSRLCAERPPDFTRLTGPLLKRAKQRLKKIHHYLFGGNPQEDLAALALAWLEGDVLPLHPKRATNARTFLGGRAEEVAQRAARGQSRPLRSLPDHPAGWIFRSPDPNLAGDPLDLVQESLRRDRRPHQLNKSLTTDKWSRVAWDSDQEPSLDRPDTLYGAILDQGISQVRWQSIVWPAGRCHWWAQGLLQLINNLDWWGAEWGNRAYLESLLEDEVGLNEVATNLLAVGLSAKHPEEAGLAVDAANLALHDGRLSGQRLGQSLAAMWAHARPQRCAKTLSQLGTLHPYPTFCALEEVLARCPIDQSQILELVHELGARIHGAVRPARARQQLETIQGSSKAAKLARQCLALAGTSEVAIQQAARVSLEGRRQRALNYNAAPAE